MRYYDLTLSAPGSSTPLRQWTSYPQGRPDPNALNIMFDMPVAPYATPIGLQTITLEGVSLADLNEAQDFAGQNLTLKAGMGGGLPLENKAQKGTIIQGVIFQSFGNWVGTDMTLDFVVRPGVFSHANPGNFTHNWLKGSTLGNTLQQTLAAAYQASPIPVYMNISGAWVNDFDVKHSCTTLEGLSAFVYAQTANKKNGPVQITIQNGNLVIFDATYQPSAITIDFKDLIGQPTWIDVNQMQMKTVMRSDLQVGSIIQMPQGYVGAPGGVTTTAQSMPSSQKYKSTFTQSFQINKLRHVGNFRSSDSGEWSTIFNCVQL